MTKAAKLIDEVIREGVHPLLRAEGFTRRHRTWNRAKGDFTQVVNIQASMWNYGEKGSFTLNLGVFSPEVWTIAEEIPLPQFVKEEQCTVRSRVGLLMEGQYDLWWDVDGATDLVSVGSDVTSKLSEFGLPFLRAHSSLETMSEWYAAKLAGHALIWTESTYAAVIMALMGDVGGCNQLLSAQIARMMKLGVQGQWRHTLDRIATRFGITLDWPDP
jgi:hypothetical protein